MRDPDLEWVEWVEYRDDLDTYPDDRLVTKQEEISQ